MRLIGIDHVDIRVRSLTAVEPFYDTVMPALGLPRKTAAHVAADGEWHEVDAARPRNAFEYYPPRVIGSIGWFVGLIEDPNMTPTATRVAFALDEEKELAKVVRLVRDAGARVVESSIDETYPAIFFEDPAGTRLEICARRPPRQL